MYYTQHRLQVYIYIYIYPLLLYLSWIFINDYYFLIGNLKFMDISFPLEEGMKTTEMEEKLFL